MPEETTTKPQPELRNIKHKEEICGKDQYLVSNKWLYCQYPTNPFCQKITAQLAGKVTAEMLQCKHLLKSAFTNPMGIFGKRSGGIHCCPNFSKIYLILPIFNTTVTRLIHVRKFHYVDKFGTKDQETG